MMGFFKLFSKNNDKTISDEECKNQSDSSTQANQIYGKPAENYRNVTFDDLWITEESKKYTYQDLEQTLFTSIFVNRACLEPDCFDSSWLLNIIEVSKKNIKDAQQKEILNILSDATKSFYIEDKTLGLSLYNDAVYKYVSYMDLKEYMSGNLNEFQTNLKAFIAKHDNEDTFNFAFALGLRGMAYMYSDRPEEAECDLHLSFLLFVLLIDGCFYMIDMDNYYFVSKCIWLWTVCEFILLKPESFKDDIKQISSHLYYCAKYYNYCFVNNPMEVCRVYIAMGYIEYLNGNIVEAKEDFEMANHKMKESLKRCSNRIVGDYCRSFTDQDELLDTIIKVQAFIDFLDSTDFSAKKHANGVNYNYIENIRKQYTNEKTIPENNDVNDYNSEFSPVDLKLEDIVDYDFASNINDFQIEDDTLIKYVGHDAFVYVPFEVKRIAQGAFAGCTFDTLSIPDTVVKIDTRALEGLVMVNNLYIPSNAEFDNLLIKLNQVNSVYREGESLLDEILYEDIIETE